MPHRCGSGALLLGGWPGPRAALWPAALRGTLTDNNIPNGPKTGPIFGRVNGNNTTFSFRYTSRCG